MSASGHSSVRLSLQPAARLRLVQWLAVVRKEVAQILADRRIIFLLVVAPLIQLLIFGNAVNFDVDRVPTVVVDHDGTEASREHLRRLLADGTLESVASVPDDATAMRMLEDGEAAVAVVVPVDFDATQLRGETASVQVMLDGTDPNRAGVAGGAASRYFGEAAMAAVVAKGGTPSGIAVVPRVFYNPRLVTSIYMVPGIAAMLLVVVTTLVTAMGLAREREMGTLEQVLVTPIPPWVLLLGKTAPYVVVGLFDVSVAIAAGGLLFDLPIRGSLVLLAVATVLYLLSTLGVGLLVSTVSQTQQQAFMGGFLFMLPAILLSGNMTPIRSMPEWLQPVTLLNPLRYYIAILRANLLKGAGWAELWPQLLALALFGVAILGVAASRFRKTLA